jgi:hypothetical protein
VVISPAASTVPVNEQRRFRALPRDRSRRRVTDELAFAWEIVEGEGKSIDNTVDQEVVFTAGAVPGLVRLRVTVTQGEVACCAEALVTVTDSLDVSAGSAVVTSAASPGTHSSGPPANCGAPDSIPSAMSSSSTTDTATSFFATRTKALQLRYLVRLYVKELVLKNFAGMPQSSCSSAWSSFLSTRRKNLRRPTDGTRL